MRTTIEIDDEPYDVDLDVDEDGWAFAGVTDADGDEVPDDDPVIPKLAEKIDDLVEEMAAESARYRRNRFR